MNRRQALVARWDDLGPFLLRKFWRPLRDSIDIFHVLPLAAAVIIFAFLATDGQFREIYIAYLEGPGAGAAQWTAADMTRWVAGIVAALAVFALISAVLNEAHYSLSALKVKTIYSSYSNPDAASSLHILQRVAAFFLVMAPWLGLAVGLFGARTFVAERYCQLLGVAGVAPDDLHAMQHLLLPGGRAIAGAVMFLGIATAAFCSINHKARVAQRVVALVAPPLAAVLFLLFTDWFIPDLADKRALIFCAVIVLAMIVYFAGYQWLYRRQNGFVFSGSKRVTDDDDSDIDPGIDAPKGVRRITLDWLLWSLSFVITQPEYSTGISLRKRRRHTLIVWALLPWVMLALYFAIVPHLVPQAQMLDLWAPSQNESLPSQCPVAATHIPVPGHWAIFPFAMCIAIGVGLFVGLLLNRFSDQWMWRRITIVAAVLALAGLARTVSSLDVDVVVSFFRFVGPLGTAALQLLFLVSIFALLAWLSQRSGFPALTLVMLAIVVSVMAPNHAGLVAVSLGVVCLVFALLAALSRLVVVATLALLLPILGLINWHELYKAPVVTQNPAASRGIDEQSVSREFQRWLEQRGMTNRAVSELEHHPGDCAGSTATTYPIYIIAAEGGGIYAASAASMFLAQLQTLCPDFAAHVFAISGVSGGAIGATIFQALDYAASPHTPTPVSPSCPHAPAATQQRHRGEPLRQKIAEIMEADHLSPVIGSIFAELLGSTNGRAEALVASFEDSVAAHDAPASQVLCAPFQDHWSPASVAPALVLNSTWVETGFRVAFAPFHLNDIDESLYSFSDPSMPQANPDQSTLTRDCSNPANERPCVSLMAAAAVSARFPLVLPPFSLVIQDPNTTGVKRWNFVDGGYSDNSGATTALDLVRVIKPLLPPRVELRVILITSSRPQPNLRSPDINGTVFRDTMAPIQALMSVRRDLGNQAVARACSVMYPDDVRNRKSEVNADCIAHAGEPHAPLQIVEIQDQTYGLSLGWKISRTSFSVVSWMLGDPSKCRGEPVGRAPLKITFTERGRAGTSTSATETGQQNTNSQLTNEILQRNSCVLSSVIDSLRG